MHVFANPVTYVHKALIVLSTSRDDELQAIIDLL